MGQWEHIFEEVIHLLCNSSGMRALLQPDERSFLIEKKNNRQMKLFFNIF